MAGLQENPSGHAQVNNQVVSSGQIHDDVLATAAHRENHSIA
jgi:hypothetical protein